MDSWTVWATPSALALLRDQKRARGFRRPEKVADEGAGGDMPVQLICPNLRCRKFLSVPDQVRGKLVKCQHCQTLFRVPEGQKKPEPIGAAKAAR